MGRNELHHNHHLHRQECFNNKTAFLPLICRVSIRDVRLRDHKDPSASSFSDDPSSPKVSCMGQVKKTHQLIDFSTPYRLTMKTATATATTTAMITSKSNTSSQGPFKYTKLKRFFSGKNLLTTTAAAAAGTVTGAAAVSKEARSRSESIIMRRNGSRRSSKINNDDGGQSSHRSDHTHFDLNISELDPPLPVTKKVAPQPSEVNLWKRRSGGLALRNLQIEQIRVPKNMHNYQPAPTV